MAITNVIFYLLSLGYMFINPDVVYIHFAVMLYNVGVNGAINVWCVHAVPAAMHSNNNQSNKVHIVPVRRC